jgi:hypothetical protein
MNYLKKNAKDLKDSGFTPQRISSAVRESRKPEPKPAKPTREPSTGSRVNVQIDTGDLFGTVWNVVRYFDRKRQAKHLARQQELDNKVLHLASHVQGIVGMPDLLMRQWCDREAGKGCFERLQASGDCTFLCTYHDEDVFVFPAFIQRIWNCHYCDSEFTASASDRQNKVCTCTNCGARLELTVV